MELSLQDCIFSGCPKVYDASTDMTGYVSITTGVGGETLTYNGATSNDAHVATS